MTNMQANDSYQHSSNLLLVRQLGLVAFAFSFMLASQVQAQTAASEMEKCAMSQKAAKNGFFKISLERAGATGFEWFAQLPRNGQVRLLEQGEESSNPGLAGGAVRQWWTMEVLKPRSGKQVEVEFYLFRTWEGKERSAKHCLAKISVE